MKLKCCALLACTLAFATVGGAASMGKPCLVPSGQPMPAGCDRGRPQSADEVRRSREINARQDRGSRDCVRSGKSGCNASAR